ncbi:MAG: carbon monoxide dehydrogenase [Firmicutes bacterium]|nr:carbon monoxide dehydrogenase [Bacillota bacterium]
MEKNKRVCRDADQMLEQFIKGLDLDTSHHRMMVQENKCGYGLQGICCRLCSNGPCRLSPARPKGVCGADADTIAVRNFLRSIAAGSGCYIHVAENAAKELMKAAENRVPLKGQETLERLAGLLGAKGYSQWDKAADIARLVLSDLRKDADEKMELAAKLAYPARTKVWEKLGILPGGAKDEIFSAVVKTSTNLNSDPADMLMHCLRLGISTGVYGLVLTNLLNDILMGEGKISFEPAGLRVIDPECVNIMVTGHQHALFSDLQDYLASEKVRQQAAAAGAKGIKLVGCTCVGQDFQLRKAAGTDAFCGHAGNNYTSEAVLATGCIDLVLSEFNCTLPGIEPICDALSIPQLCLDDVAKKANAQSLPYTYEQKEEISRIIADKALESYQNKGICRTPSQEKNQGLAGRLAEGIISIAGRELQGADLEKALAQLVSQNTGKGRTNAMASHGYADVITGVTEVTLKEFLGGSYGPLIDLLKQGKIKGIAGVVGCSNLRAKGHDVYTVELVKKLIQKDILVLSAGCTCGGLANCGLMSPQAADLAGENLKAVCKSLGIPPVLNFGPCLAIGRMELAAGELAGELGIDLPQLPLVLSAPQWLEEQALADGAFALALGFTLHLGLPPFVTGSPVALDVLTNQMKQLTGGQLVVETDIDAAADKLEAVIAQKRSGLGI